MYFLSRYTNWTMGFDYEHDFCLTSGKRGGGARKQPREKARQNAPTCYSSKHIRAKEALLAKKDK